jgi:hypothetical protein
MSYGIDGDDEGDGVRDGHVPISRRDRPLVYERAHGIGVEDLYAVLETVGHRPAVVDLLH